MESSHSSHTVIDRRDFLRHYKIKKKALPPENKTNDITQTHIGDKVDCLRIILLI